jgi:hypothetical protein
VVVCAFFGRIEVPADSGISPPIAVESRTVRPILPALRLAFTSGFLSVHPV